MKNIKWFRIWIFWVLATSLIMSIGGLAFAEEKPKEAFMTQFLCKDVDSWRLIMNIEAEMHARAMEAGKGKEAARMVAEQAGLEVAQSLVKDGENAPCYYSPVRMQVELVELMGPGTVLADGIKWFVARVAVPGAKGTFFAMFKGPDIDAHNKTKEAH